MQDITRISPRPEGLTPEEIRQTLLESLRGRALRRVLILPPDYTRFRPRHARAGHKGAVGRDVRRYPL